MQDNPLHVSDYSILNLNAKIEEFLVYYLHFFFQTKIKIKFGYDSRNQSLCVEGNTNDVKQSYQIMKDMISKYKASQFSLGFSAAFLMNFFVGGIADKPNIKFFDSKKVEELNKFPKIKIEAPQNQTFMVGPKKQVDKLMEELARWVAGSVAGAIVQHQQIKKQIQQNIKQVKAEKIEYIAKSKQIQNLPHPPQMQQKRNSQKVSKHIPQQKLQLKKSPSQPEILRQQSEKSVQIGNNEGKMLKRNEQNMKVHIVNVQNPKQIYDKVPKQQGSNQKLPMSLNGAQDLNNNANDKKINVYFTLPIDEKLEQSMMACIFIQNKITQILKFELPQFILVQSKFIPKQIVISGIVFDMQIKKIGDNIIQKFLKQTQIQVIEVNISSGSFFVEIRKNHQFKLFACDGRKKVIHIYSTTIGQEKIDNLKNIVKQVIKKYSFPENQSNQQINFSSIAQEPSSIKPILPVNIPQAQLQPFIDAKPVVSLPQVPSLQVDKNKKLSKKHFRFPYYIGQQIWNFAEEMSEKINEVNINFNPQSKFYGSSSHIHIFQDSSFSAKGPQKQMKQFAAAVQSKILSLKQQKFVSNLEITESMYKKMTHQYDKLKKIQAQHKVKIVTNPQIIANYQAKQILVSKQNKKLQIFGIKGSLCDLFIDNFGTILIFDRERDLQKYKNSFSNLKNIIEDKIYSIMGVCQKKDIRLCEFIQQTASQYITKISPAKLKIFVFAELTSLKQLIWDLIEIVNNIKVKHLQFFLVFQQGSQQQIKNIPDRYKRWYTLIGHKNFYSEAGNTALNRAVQNGENQIVLNSDHIVYNRPTHTAYIDRHMFSHYKYKFGLDIKYRDCQDWIQFDYEGKTYKLGDCRFKEIRQAEKNKEKQMELSISLFKIDIKQMKQVNVWNNYERDIYFQEISLMEKNLMVSYQSSKYVTLVIGASKDSIVNAMNAINTQFFRLCKQVLKINNNVKQVQIQKLYKLCSSYNVQISKISNTQFQITFELGHPSIDVIQKYVQMIKSEDIGVIYPPSWKHDPKNPQKYVEMDVDEKSLEYQNIVKVFPYKVLKLKRIQNYNAYSRYFNEKKFLEKLNGGKPIKQLLLYHGTRTMDPSLITADKQITFNINYSADKNYMGRATYFAERAQYSHNYRYKMNVNTGVMLLCVVQVGDSQKCPKLHVNYLDTDFKDASKTIRFESMTEFYDGSQIYTIYKNNRAYPMYRIQYKV